MSEYRWKYAVEVQKANGSWNHGTIWAVYPGDFRAFLRYINGEDNPCNGQIVMITSGPPVRVKRIEDDAEAQFNWPEDRKVYPC